MTDCLVSEYSAFGSAETYFASYAVLGDALVGLTVPVQIITAADDPVIPVEDFYELAPDPLLAVDIQPAGGHVGFVDLFPFRHRLPEMILDLLGQVSAGAGPASIHLDGCGDSETSDAGNPVGMQP
jgi:predicted alpha/beta-fold hydrolase